MPNKPTARRPPSMDERRQRRAFRAWWLVAILGATVGGLLLLLASGGDDPEESPPPAADATTAAPAGGLAECALLPETWEFAVTGTEESSERGTPLRRDGRDPERIAGTHPRVATTVRDVGSR